MVSPRRSVRAEPGAQRVLAHSRQLRPSADAAWWTGDEAGQGGLDRTRVRRMGTRGLGVACAAAFEPSPFITALVPAVMLLRASRRGDRVAGGITASQVRWRAW